MKPIDDMDPLHEQIRKARKRLADLCAKRANRPVTHDWFWCATGEHKVIRSLDGPACPTCAQNGRPQ